jgi:uncharacterized membrane protein
MTSNEAQGVSQGSGIDLKTWNMITYGLYAIGIFMGGLPWIVAVIMNYVKLGDSKGTIYESHAQWQIKLFWWSLIIGIVGILSIWIVIGFFILGGLWIWMIYKVVRGIVALFDGKPMYQ